LYKKQPKKTPRVFEKNPLKKKQSNPLFNFPLKNLLRSKNKRNRTFVQLNKTNSNDIERTRKKEKNKSNSLTKFQWLSSSALHNRYILSNFSAFSASKLFLILDHTKSYVEKMHSVDAELAGHAHKLHMKL